jgi:hypothetical protein
MHVISMAWLLGGLGFVPLESVETQLSASFYWYLIIAHFLEGHG